MYIDKYSGYDPTKTSTYNFYGLNRTRRTSKGEFSDMLNMSTLEYPCAAPRGPRLPVAKAPGIIQAVAAPDISNVSDITAFTGIANEAFYYNGERITSSNTSSKKYAILKSDFSWSITRYASYYIIHGYNNQTNVSETYLYNISTGTFENLLTTMDSLIVTAGKASSGNYLQTFRYAYDTVANYKVTLKDGTVLENIDFFDKYASSAGILPKDNIFEKVFKIGDELTIKNFPTGTENVGQTWTYSASYDEITQYNGYDYSRNNTVDTDAILNINTVSKYSITSAVVIGFDVSTYSISGVGTTYIHRIYFKLYNKNGEEVDFNDMGSMYCTGVSISKRKRTFTHICMHDGRIFGSVPNGNVLYGSAADDIEDFSDKSVANNIASRIELGTVGSPTAICEYGTSLLVFKEQSITVINGNEPYNYYHDTINGIGCIDPKSVAVTPSGVIFLSYNGFYIYSGNVPSCISSRLNTKYISACAGYDGNIYYASAVRLDDNVRELLTYDMRYNVWHKQDDFNAFGFFPFRGKFYMANNLNIFQLDGSGPSAVDVDWSFTSVRYHDNTFEMKGIEMLWFRVEIEKGAWFTVETCCNDGEFKMHSRFSEPGLQSLSCPVRMAMCQNYRYRISGSGNVIFYEIEINKSFGGRIHKSKDSTLQLTAEQKNDDNDFYDY